MAFGGLLALLDDITVIMDDVAVMTKVAAKKTAGVVGDDLAVSADQLNGIDPKRELPIVAEVAKGSMRNKMLLVPSALAISAFAPGLIAPLLLMGGAYLCYEGVEKILHKKNSKEDKAHHQELTLAAATSSTALKKVEEEKIKGAIRTDLVLSGEIVIIALGAVAAMPLATQVGVLSAIGVGMTGFVYGLVAGIVKIDDMGLYLSKKESPALRKMGEGILAAAPKLMKGLSIAGTAAMFMVGGGILAHNIPVLHHALETGLHFMTSNATAMGMLEIGANAALGVAGGFLALGGEKLLHAPLVKTAEALGKVYNKGPQKLLEPLKKGLGTGLKKIAHPLVAIESAVYKAGYYALALPLIFAAKIIGKTLEKSIELVSKKK